MSQKIKQGTLYITERPNIKVMGTGPDGEVKERYTSDFKGDPGPTGKGITSIIKTGTVGLVKTYRITYTDDTTFDYTVTDGANGTGTLSSVVAGTNISIDNTDVNNPVINNTQDISQLNTAPTDLKLSTASKGGLLRNIDKAVGDVAITDTGWVEDEKHGVYALKDGGTVSFEFDSAITRTGRLTAKITTSGALSRGRLVFGNNTTGGATIPISSLRKYAIQAKPSTIYKFTAAIKYKNLVSINTLAVREYDSSGNRLVSNLYPKESGTITEFSERIVKFTTNASTAFLIIDTGCGAAGDAQEFSIDVNSMTLEEVVEDTTYTGKTIETVRPVLQAITSTDNIDQSLDPTGAYANTYALPTSIDEGATHRQTFTPTKKYITRIGVWVVAKGTGNWTLAVHDASNNLLASKAITNASLTAGAFNYFDVPNVWASGNLHFHLYSSVADGTARANTSDDLETASYIQEYAKKSEGFTLISNGIKTELKADKDGLLSNSIIDLDNGKYRYKGLFQLSSTNLQDIYSADAGGISVSSIVNGYSGQTTTMFSAQTTSVLSVVVKVNTVLPIKSLILSSAAPEYAGRQCRIQISADNIIYTAVEDLVWDTASGGSSADVAKSANISSLNGKNIFYVKFTKDADNDFLIFSNLGIEADLDTSSIPQGLFYPLGVNQFTETWKATGTVLSYVYRKAKYTNENGVVMPAIELNSGATGTGSALGYLPLKIDNSQETTPAVTILTASGVASDTVLNTDGGYVALATGATEGKIDYNVTITKNTYYLSSNAESSDSTQDPSHQQNVILGIRQQGLIQSLGDTKNVIADLKKGLADTKTLVQNGVLNFGVDTGTTDDYAISIPNITSYQTGMRINFKATTANTDGATLNINDLGAKAIVKGVSTALSTNDILAGMFCEVIFDGTNFVLLNPRAL